MGINELDFELQPLKAKIKGVFNWLYCCYGNSTSAINNNNSDKLLMSSFQGIWQCKLIIDMRLPSSTRYCFA